MRIKRPKNTKEKGFIEFFIYPEKNKLVGVCLTFDIVVEGENPNKIMKDLKDAAFLHLKVVVKNKLSDNLLNRYAPKEYWEKYFSALESLKRAELSKRQKAESFQLRYEPSLGGLNSAFAC